MTLSGTYVFLEYTFVHQKSCLWDCTLLNLFWREINNKAWRAASLSDRNMGGNLSPIWQEGHCLNSAKHRPLRAWNHTWAEMRIPFRGLLWSFIWHYLSTAHFSRHYWKADETNTTQKNNLVEWKSLQNSASVGKLVAV